MTDDLGKDIDRLASSSVLDFLREESGKIEDELNRVRLQLKCLETVLRMEEGKILNLKSEIEIYSLEMEKSTDGRVDIDFRDKWKRIKESHVKILYILAGLEVTNKVAE